MVIIYISVIVLLVSICALVFWHICDVKSKHPIDNKDASTWGSLTWKTDDVTSVSDLFTTRSNFSDNLDWVIDDLTDDINIKESFIKELTTDLVLIEAYHPEVSFQQLLVYSAAYLLVNKTSDRLAEQHISGLREFDFVTKSRTKDQARVILNDIKGEPKRLAISLIEDKLKQYNHLGHTEYKDTVYNIALSLIDRAKDLQ